MCDKKYGNTFEEYKRYQEKYLPQCRTIEGYEAPDFNKTSYPQCEELLGKLELYLIELRKYVYHLRKSAKLRQLHYEKYLKENLLEDNDHKYFREAMNELAIDGEEKLEYWKNMTNNLMSKAINKFEKIERRRKRAKVNLDLRNVDFESSIQSKSIVKRPKICIEEKKKRRRERKKRAIKKKRAQELEREKEAERIMKEMINSTTATKKELHSDIKFDVTFNAKKILAQIKSAKPNVMIAEIHNKFKTCSVIVPEFDKKNRNTYARVGFAYANACYHHTTPTEERTSEVVILSWCSEFCGGFLMQLCNNIINECPKPMIKETMYEYYESIYDYRCIYAVLSNIRYQTIEKIVINVFQTTNCDNKLYLDYLVLFELEKFKADVWRKLNQLEIIKTEMINNPKYATLIYKQRIIRHPKLFTISIEQPAHIDRILFSKEQRSKIQSMVSEIRKLAGVVR